MSSVPQNGVHFAKVEVRKVSGKTNLTGYPRKIRDNCADIFNLTKKWSNLNVKGKDVLTRISDARLSGEVSEDNFPMLAALCSDLTGILHSMNEILSRLDQISTSLHLISNLSTSPTHHAHPPFTTWPVTRFYQVSARIHNMLRQEYDVKESVAQQVAHLTSRDQLMFYTSLWLHQAHIDNTFESLVESLLLETGLK